MKNLTELLIKRRSTRKYSEEPLKAEEVHLILQSALLSPSSKSTTGWHFIVIEDKGMLSHLSHCKEHGATPIAGSAIAVVVVGDPMKSDVWIEDCSIAMTSMQLQAEELNIGSCWIQVRNRYTEFGQSSEEYVRLALSIPENKTILSILSLGYKAVERKANDIENLLWEQVHINQW